MSTEPKRYYQDSAGIVEFPAAAGYVPDGSPAEPLRVESWYQSHGLQIHAWIAEPAIAYWKLLREHPDAERVLLGPTKTTRPFFWQLVTSELTAAREKHHMALNSPHEAWAVIIEELDEFKAEVFKQCHDKREMLRELIQTAAMCQRAAEDLGLFNADNIEGALAATEKKESKACECCESEMPAAIEISVLSDAAAGVDGEYIRTSDVARILTEAVEKIAKIAEGGR